MIMDATFWVTVSFFIFLGIITYFKIPQKIKEALEQNISNIKNKMLKRELDSLKIRLKRILKTHQ